MKIGKWKVIRKMSALLAGIILFEQISGTLPMIYACAEEDTTTAYSIEHKITSSWDGGCNAEITLTNLSESETLDWSFSFNSYDYITSLWGGKITEKITEADDSILENENNARNYYRYTVEAADYTSVIPAKGSVTIGYNASGEDHEIWDESAEFVFASGHEKSSEPDEGNNVKEQEECIHEGAFDYVLCTTGADDTLEINAGDIEIKGDVHSNGDFIYRGNSLEVDGSVESSKSVMVSVSDPDFRDKIGVVYEKNDTLEMPDLYECIREDLKENADRFTSDIYCYGDIADISGNIYTDGYAGIYTPTTLSNGILYAEEGIQYSCGALSNTDNTRILLVSGSGDIHIYANNVSIYGNIYAPNGTVCITGSDVEIHGRITAKHFDFYGSNLKLIAGSGDNAVYRYYENEPEEEKLPQADGYLVPEKNVRLINIADENGDHDALRPAAEMLDADDYDMDYKSYEIAAGSLASQSGECGLTGNTDTAGKPDTISENGIRLTGRSVSEDANGYDLSWKADDGSEVSGYRLLRKMDDGDYTSISTWDGETHIRVLNIFPDWNRKNNFTDWMKSTIGSEGCSADMGLFDIDTVMIDDYNEDPDSYLKDENGYYKYDVLFFGVADSNNGKDLSSEALRATKSFLNSGRGALLGHDTICNTGGAVHRNFASLADRLGIICSKNSTFSGSGEVEIVREGTLTTYPWLLRGRLSIPYSHTQGQLSGGNLPGLVWMKYVTTPGIVDEETGADNIGYLVTNNQVALIQTGHWNGPASDDERKIMANTICYLAQFTMKNRCRDATAYDLAAPVLNSIGFRYQGEDLVLCLKARDIGTLYNYYVVAMQENETSEELHSNSVYHNAKTGMDGFLIAIDESEDDRADLAEKDDEGNYRYFVSAAGGNGVFEIPEEYLGSKAYAHICAVDKAGNVSKQITCKIDTAQADLFKALEEGAEYIYLDADLSSWTDMECAELEKAIEESGAKIFIASETEDVTESIRIAEEKRQELRLQSLFIGERAGVIVRNSETGEEYAPEDIEVILFRGDDRYVFDELPVTFSESGTYKVVVCVKQNDSWSEEMVLAEKIRVTERPQCRIETIAEYDPDANDYIITTTEKTWVPGDENAELTSAYAWKKIGDTKWTDGSLPKRLEAGAVYLYRLTAEDENGIASTPGVSIIDAPIVAGSIEGELFEEEKPMTDNPEDPDDPENPDVPKEEPQDDPDLIRFVSAMLDEKQNVVRISGETIEEYSVETMSFGVFQADETYKELYQWYTDREGVALEDGVEFTYGDHKWTWVIPVDVLGAGTHTLYAEAKDDDGHESECRAELTLNITETTEIIEVTDPEEPDDPEEEEVYRLAWYTDVKQSREGVSLSGRVTTERNVTEMSLGMITQENTEQEFYRWYADKEDIVAQDGISLEKEGADWVLKLPFGFLEAGEYQIYVKATDDEGKKNDFRAILRLSSWVETENTIEVKTEDPDTPEDTDPGVYPELDHVELSSEKDRLLIIGTGGDYLYRPDENAELHADENGEVKGYYTLYVLNAAEETIPVSEEESERALANIPVEGLASGVYTVVLTAYGMDDSLRAIRSIGFNYKAPEKQETETQEIIPDGISDDDPFGNLHIGFTDIVTTFPFGQTSLSRYYNSNHLEKGDFGYGWTMGLLGMRLEESADLNDGYSLKYVGYGLSTTYYIEEIKSHDIVVRYGDGSYDRFKVALSPGTQAIRPIEHVNVGFECVTSDGVELAIDGDNGAQYLEGMLLWDDASNETGINYVLTAKDGSKLYLNALDGLTHIVDTNGNMTTVDDDGYHSENGQGIDWTRDGEDRITKAWDHLGHSMTYTYDGKGDLIRTEDMAGYTVTYTYNEMHQLISITDPDGKEVARNNYDENGRLVSVTDADGNTTAYSYEDDGRTESITDANGNITVYTYDDHGNVLSETDPYGYTARNTYDEKNNLLTQTDKRGYTTSYAYDEKGNLIDITATDGTKSAMSVDQSTHTGTVAVNGIILATVKTDSKGNVTRSIDALGNATDYSYTADGKISSISDEIGTCNTFTYNGEGQLISVTSGDGTTVEFIYDSYGNVVTMRIIGTDGTVHTAEMLYDLSGNLTGTVDEEGNTTSYVNDAKGNVISSTDTMGRVTTYTYDSLSRVTCVNYPDGTKESFTYDGNGNCLSATDRLGLTRRMSYDKCNRLTKIIYPDGTAESYSYDANGNVTKHISVTGAVYEYSYSSRNFLISVKRDDGAAATYAYDAQGRTTAYTDLNGNTWKYGYDENGNRISVTAPDGGVTGASYDARRRVISCTDAEGNTTVYNYDAMNRLISVTDALGNTWSYTYDFMGNLMSVTDAHHHVSVYGYDAAGRCVRVTNAAGDSRTCEYDAEGKIVKCTGYDGSVTTYSYDEKGYQTGMARNGRMISTSYDACGRLLSVSNGESTVSYTYDSYSRIASRNDGSGNIVYYGYDTYGRLNSIVAKRGDNVISSTGYTYDKYDRTVKVSDTAGNVTVFTYDPMGLVSTMTTADGMVTEYEYDSCGRIVEETVTAADGIKIFDYSYTYGLCGEMLSVTELSADGKSVVTTYTYDEVLRLVQEKTTDGVGTLTIGYAYDAVSNRISMSLTSEGDISGFVNAEENLCFGTTTYSYNALDQLESETTPIGTNTYTYDGNGNLSSISGGKAVQYAYDEYGRLKTVSVTSNGIATTESYTYDAEGNRISCTTGSETVYYVNDACADLTQVLAELNADGTLKKEYAGGLSVISATGGDAEISYFVTDGQGNIRAIIAGGAVIDTYRYDAYGSLIEKTGDSDNDLLYNGEQYSAATGLYYLRARYMDPSTGRFISMDAYAGDLVSPTSTHKYLYANANPVMYSDPSGYEATMAEDVTSMAIARALQGALVGALIGAFHADVDPECQGWDRVWSTLICAGSGALGGIAFAYCPFLIGPASVLSMIASRLAAIEAEQKGYTKLAFFNNVMVVASAVSLVIYLKCDLPKLLEPKGTIGGNNPLENIEYTDKVLKQMQQGDYHAFPDSVTAFGDMANAEQIIGGDGVARMKYEIGGSYNGKNGVFQFIIEPDGYTCNHRLFVPSQ